MPENIRTVFFDLDGTLKHHIPTGGDVFRDYAVSLGVRASDDDRLRAMRWEHFYWADSPELHADFRTYTDETREFWVNYGRRQLIALGASSAQAQEFAPIISQRMEENYVSRNVVPEDVLAALNHFKETGYKMGVLSNRNNPFVNELEELGIASFFDLVLAAGEVNSFKPHPGLFEAALQRADSIAEETIYVGDNYFADVIGAQRAGLTPVLYDPRGIFPHAACAAIKSFDELIPLDVSKLFDTTGA